MILLQTKLRKWKKFIWTKMFGPKWEIYYLLDVDTDQLYLATQLFMLEDTEDLEQSEL